MRGVRAAILEDRFLALYEKKRAFLHEPDLDNPTTRPKPSRKRRTALGQYDHVKGCLVQMQKVLPDMPAEVCQPWTNWVEVSKTINIKNSTSAQP